MNKTTLLKVWINPKSKSKIELDPQQLRDSVSSGHDNDWNWNVWDITASLNNGDTEGETKITRYHGGGSDTVFWKLIK